MSRRNTWNLDVKSLGLRGSTTPPPLKTHIAENVRILCSKVRARMRREGRRTRGLEISPPFDFKHEVAGLPGISSNELTLLREKAAASCLGVADKPRPVSALAIHPVFLFPCSESAGRTESKKGNTRRMCDRVA